MEIFRDTDIEKLLEIKEPIPISHIPFWTSEIYGFGKYIRQYGFYPKDWPLFVFTDHSGPHTINKLNKFELSHNATVTLMHDPQIVKKYKKKTKKNCHVLYSPFVFYRRKNKIFKTAVSAGTIAYPAHSIPTLKETSDILIYINELKNLPEKLKPVSISLHYYDLKRGMHLKFLDHGYRVFTAGNPLDYKYTERFFELLRRFKYATSNFIGSYMFYAVEMGIPFFRYGTRPQFRKKDSSKAAYEAYICASTRDELLKNYEEAFAKITENVLPKQAALVNRALGLEHGVSRPKMALLLFSSIFQHHLLKLKNHFFQLLSFKKPQYETSK